MQFQGKLIMDRTLENDKKSNFRHNFGLFGQICTPPPPIFFRGFYLYELLDIVSGYHCTQFQGTVMKQTS